jgi:hypothetical protein
MISYHNEKIESNSWQDFAHEGAECACFHGGQCTSFNKAPHAGHSILADDWTVYLVFCLELKIFMGHHAIIMGLS